MSIGILSAAHRHHYIQFIHFNILVLFCFLMQGACHRYGEWRWFSSHLIGMFCVWTSLAGAMAISLLVYCSIDNRCAHVHIDSETECECNRSDGYRWIVDVVVLMRSKDRNVNAVVENLFIVFEYEWSVSNNIQIIMNSTEPRAKWPCEPKVIRIE